jgi:hypothetical protein
MVERGCELGLAEKPRTKLVVHREFRRDHLEGDLAREALVGRQVDRAHPAAAEQRLDDVFAEHLADPRGQTISHEVAGTSARGTRADARFRSDAGH